jgi:hypothetical protein
MTGDGVSGLGPSDLLDACDRALGEVGRRSHLFSWLRPNGPGAGWLPVDAYYPRHRLVVICREQAEQHDGLYAELIPRHGLHLLELSPRTLGDDREQVPLALSAMLEQFAIPPPPPEPEPDTPRRPPRGANIAQAAAALAVPAAPRFPHDFHRPPRRALEPEALAAGMVLGLALVGALIAEVYLDVSVVAVSDGYILLAFGIALDVVARALGTLAARRAGTIGWAWACALVGSLAVARFTLFSSDGPVAADPAPIAGLLSLLALAVIAGGVVAEAL